MNQISRREFLIASMATLSSALASGQARSLSWLAGGQANQRNPNFVIIVFDTLSAPHMSLYGYRRQTTANLERFASRATVFHRHYAGGNFTTPGTATLLTGTYPWTHRAFNQGGTVAERFRNQNLFSTFDHAGYFRIAYSHNLLANSILNQCGDHIELHLPPNSFCLSSGEVRVPWLDNDADLVWRGFEDLILKRGQGQPSSLFLSLADRLRVAAEKRIKTRPLITDYPRGVPELYKLTFTLEDTIDGIQDVLASAPQPFLAYFHLLPPHEPYHPHRDFVGLFDDGWEPEGKPLSEFSDGIGQKQLNQFRRQYDEFLAYSDHHFGRLFDFLVSSGRIEDSIVVFTSDHGQLFERGIHGHITPSLYEPVIKVPFLISLPGQTERQDVHTLTSNADLVPTLAHLAGQSALDWDDGAIIPPYGPDENTRTILAVEAQRNPKNSRLKATTLALWSDSYKAIKYLGQPKRADGLELFDLERDPEEQSNIAETKRSVAAEFENQLNSRLEEIDRMYVNRRSS
jgi:arylsulfatase A-like enzyme